MSSTKKHKSLAERIAALTNPQARTGTLQGLPMCMLLGGSVILFAKYLNVSIAINTNSLSTLLLYNSFTFVRNQS